MNFIDRVRLIMTKFTASPPPAPIQPRDFTGGSMPGPGTPITMGTEAQTETPRLFDYEYNLNSNFQPRTEYGFLPTFFHLHAFFQLSPEARVAANYFIEKILSVPWELKVRKEATGTVDDARMKLFRRMVEMPDPTVQWRYEQWMRAMLQEMVVTDAVTVYPLRSRGGDFLAWQLIDGQTIKPLLGLKGGRPAPPSPAFIQYIHGVPHTALMADDLIYYPFRPRVWCAYGESRVEEIITTLAQLSAHGAYTGLWFNSGNIPESVALMDPEGAKGMTEKQLLVWQKAMDEVVGMTTARRRLFVMPPHIKDVKPVKEFTFSRELPEWLVRILCVQFGVPAMLFVSETNRSTAQEITRSLTDMQFRRTLMSVKRFWDELLRVAGADDLEFVFRQPRDFSAEAVEGIFKLATTATPTGQAVMTIDEARKELGLADETDNEPQGADNDLDGEDGALDAAATAEASGPAGAPEAPAPEGTQQQLPAPGAATPVTKAAPQSAHPVNLKAVAHKSVAAKSRQAVRMLKAVKPILDAQRKAAVDDARRMAAARGKKVTG